MTNSSDPIFHQQAEKVFLDHVVKLLKDPSFRIDTVRGNKSVTSFLAPTLDGPDEAKARGELKRIMDELGQPDRDLQNKMPVGLRLDAAFAQRRMLFFKTPIANVTVISLVPIRELL